MAVLSLDVGGSFIKAALFAGTAMALPKIPTPQDTLEHFLQAVVSLWRNQKDVEAIAMSMPGVVEEQTGFMVTGGSLKYIQNLNLAAEISTRCGKIPVRIVNDAKAGALAELHTGALQDVQNGVLVTLGTAVGGAVILQRQVVAGRHHFAGEFSYLILGHSEGQITKTLGNNGGSACVSKFYEEKTGRVCPPEEVFLAAQSDPAALDSVTEYCRLLALPLVNMQCIVDPERIVIGGGISRQPLLIQTLREQVHLLQVQTGFLTYGMPEVQIAACRYCDNTYGAYYAYLEWKDGGTEDVER